MLQNLKVGKVNIIYLRVTQPQVPRPVLTVLIFFCAFPPYVVLFRGSMDVGIQSMHILNVGQ